ncbi:hypothetical protein Ahia01_000841800, partial [Argonauta hians]
VNMAGLNQRRNDYLKRWQVFKSEREQQSGGKSQMLSRRKTMCFGGRKSSSSSSLAAAAAGRGGQRGEGRFLGKENAVAALVGVKSEMVVEEEDMEVVFANDNNNNNNNNNNNVAGQEEGEVEENGNCEDGDGEEKTEKEKKKKKVVVVVAGAAAGKDHHDDDDGPSVGRRRRVPLSNKQLRFSVGGGGGGGEGRHLVAAGGGVKGGRKIERTNERKSLQQRASVGPAGRRSRMSGVTSSVAAAARTSQGQGARYVPSRTDSNLTVAATAGGVGGSCGRVDRRKSVAVVGVKRRATMGGGGGGGVSLLRQRKSLLPHRRSVAACTTTTATHTTTTTPGRRKGGGGERYVYMLDDLNTPLNFGTPNTLSVPPLVKRVTRPPVATDTTTNHTNNTNTTTNRTNTNHPTDTTTNNNTNTTDSTNTNTTDSTNTNTTRPAAKVELKPHPPQSRSLTAKKRHLYRSKETISSSCKKISRLATDATTTTSNTNTDTSKALVSKKLNFTGRRKTIGQGRCTPSTKAAQKKHTTTTTTTTATTTTTTATTTTTTIPTTDKEATRKDEIQQELQTVLEECSILLDSGCPPGHILSWMEEIRQRIPSCVQSARFWMVKARVHSLLTDVDRLFEVFGNAMMYKAEPADVITESLPKMIKDAVAATAAAATAAATNATTTNTTTPPLPALPTTPSSGSCRRRRALRTRGRSSTADLVPYTPSQTPYNMPTSVGRALPARDDWYADTPMPSACTPTTATPGLDGHLRRSFQSGNIKYLVRPSTPFKYRTDRVKDSDALLVTPVRRSARRSVVSCRKSQLDVIIDSLGDCVLGDKTNVLFQDNPAITLDYQ